jgi:predicted nuclease of predicted toxin-antitoxin system
LSGVTIFNTDVLNWLRNQAYEVYSVYDEARGISDDDVLQKAFNENWILITNDKDFGNKIYQEGCSHKGVIFMRLEDERTANKIETLRRLL